MQLQYIGHLYMSIPTDLPSEYKVAIKEVTKNLVSLGLADILKSDVSLVEAVEQLNQGLEKNERSLYGQPLGEKTLLGMIAKTDVEIT